MNERPVIACLATLATAAWTAASFATAGGPSMRAPLQVRFVGPTAGGLRVDYQAGREGRFTGRPLVTPARLDFPQPGVYRLKLTHIPGHEAATFYPTLELVPMSPGTAVFLAHSSIVVEFTDRDFAEAAAGKLVTRVLYMPAAEPAAGRGSQRLLPLAIVRLGDRQLEDP